VRFKSVILANEFIDRVEQFEFLFKQAEPAFNFSVCLRGFHPGDDVVDVVLFKELLERMVRQITIPS
jgi:hypothetical protein